ncbi:MAG: nucleotidyltransferase domain-containing protein [Opitutae bacterium]|nr:nucleotidyltransferase domain-containing protein [Opitutae bacterium]MBC9889370.1 nucleotidyltransferase domain-containing protein [Opitutae bacterium]
MRNEPEIKGGAGLDQTTLDDIIRRIVEVADPQRIILFGSFARGDMNCHSDFDLLVVKEGGNPWAVMGDIYGNLRGVGAAVDAIVVTPQAMERYKDSHALIIKPALREGKVVYESPCVLCES